MRRPARMCYGGGMSSAGLKDAMEQAPAPGSPATQVCAPEPEEAELRSRALYDQDEYGWLLQQAALLRAGRLEEVDRASLAEFLTDMAGSHRNAFQSAMTVLLHHMLKVLVQPERTTRSWLLTVRVQQRQARFVMKENPGMRQRLPALYVEAYADARGDVAAETGIAISRLPADNPWTLDEALAFVPPEPPPRARRAAQSG